MFIHSGTLKRAGILAAVVAVGTAAAITYNAFLSSDDGLPEVLSPLQPIIKDEDGGVKQKTDIAFSPDGSFFDKDISVELKAKDKTATIYYTTNGETPTKKSNRYTNPIKVHSSGEVTAKTIKAIAVSENGTSEVFTKSYVTGEGVSDRFEKGTYIFVLSTDSENLYDYEKGIAVAGKIRDEWIANEYDGKSEITPNEPANWNQEGMAGERPMYVEAFSSSGELLVSQQAGARVAGAYSAAVDQKSWKLIARTMYTGDKGKFSYPFFSDATDENGAILTKIDRIVLRNGANDREFAGVRDELSMSLAKQSGYLDAQSTAPAAVFLNGKYYGFAWLHQNFSRAYLEERYGGTKDNYQVVGKAEGEIVDENAEGAADDYNKVLELAESGLTDDKKFEQFCSMVDIDNYMHYLAMQLFIDNRDWPGNNYKVWRYVASDGEEVTSKYQDGKWRYFFYDAEFAWGLYSDGYANKTLTKILNGTHPAGGSVLISALMERADMREKLANNLCDLIGGAFSSENILATLEQKLADSDKEQYQDGKWRYFFYDAEFAWGLYSDGYANKTLTKILNGTHPAGGSVLISALMERADMREKLANNLCDLIGGAFSSENILATLEQKLADSDKEQLYALNKGITSTWANEGTFENSRNEIREFADKRANIILSDICKNFGIDKDDTYKVKLNGAKGLKLTMNIQTVKDSNTVTSEYFTPYKVKLTAEDMSGYTFTSWEINGKTYTDREITIDSSMAKKGKITINARSEKTSSTGELLYISEVYTGGDADWIELYNPNDNDVSTKGLYLTDKDDMLNRYKIPTVNIKPHSTLTIVCKNNKSENTLMKMQTNFSLKTGETLILSNESGEILGKVAIIDCSKDESLVRQRDGSYAKGTPTFEKNSQ